MKPHSISETKVTTRLFIGCLITAEMRMFLNQSIQWKHANILANKNSEDLREVHFHGKDYIGLYIEDAKYTVLQLKGFEDAIKRQLHSYNTKIEVEKLNPVIFPQLFIA